MTATPPTGVLRVHCADQRVARDLADSVRAVLGLHAEVRSDPERRSSVEVPTAAIDAPSPADMILVTERDDRAKGDATNEPRAATGSTGRTITLALPADDADPIDVARLLGPVLRGRMPPNELPSLVAEYRSLQSLGSMLERNTIDIEGVERAAPELIGALHADLARPDTLQLWGTSTTVDNGEQQVPTPFIAYLAEQLGTPPDPARCHAGLVHTYGYLLSSVATPFGRKRHRWSSGEAAHALGIPGRWPLIDDGVLSNLTHTLTKVAPLGTSMPGRAGPAGLSALHEVRDHGVADGTRWRSRIRVLGRIGSTDQSSPGGDELLLVYTVSVDDGPERYITAFPVGHTFAAAATRTPIGQLRFNASVRQGEVPDSRVSG